MLEDLRVRRPEVAQHGEEGVWYPLDSDAFSSEEPSDSERFIDLNSSWADREALAAHTGDWVRIVILRDFSATTLVSDSEVPINPRQFLTDLFLVCFCHLLFCILRCNFERSILSAGCIVRATMAVDARLRNSDCERRDTVSRRHGRSAGGARRPTTQASGGHQGQ